jgi:hypothetical protein
MNIDTLVDLLIDAFIADASILTWCNTNYSTPHTIYKGIDLRKPPPEADYPVIHIWPINKSCGYGLTQKPHGIGVVTGIKDSTQSSDTDTNLVTVKKYRGLARIEAFRKLVESSIVTEIGSNTNTVELTEDSLEISYETIESFPFFLAIDMWMLTEEYSQGDDVFA